MVNSIMEIPEDMVIQIELHSVEGIRRCFEQGIGQSGRNGNQSLDMHRVFIHHHADLTQTFPGLIWGKGYEWETFVPSVNPISYAMTGLLPRMHRDERMIAETISFLLKEAYGIDYASQNVPNRYLKQLNGDHGENSNGIGR